MTNKIDVYVHPIKSVSQLKEMFEDGEISTIQLKEEFELGQNFIKQNTRETK